MRTISRERLGDTILNILGAPVGYHRQHKSGSLVESFTPKFGLLGPEFVKDFQQRCTQDPNFLDPQYPGKKVWAETNGARVVFTTFSGAIPREIDWKIRFGK